MAFTNQQIYILDNDNYIKFFAQICKFPQN